MKCNSNNCELVHPKVNEPVECPKCGKIVMAVVIEHPVKSTGEVHKEYSFMDLDKLANNTILEEYD
jgi:hypothetical protein